MTEVLGPGIEVWVALPIRARNGRKQQWHFLTIPFSHQLDRYGCDLGTATKCLLNQASGLCLSLLDHLLKGLPGVGIDSARELLCLSPGSGMSHAQTDQNQKEELPDR